MATPETTDQVKNPELDSAMVRLKAGPTPEVSAQVLQALFRGTFIAPVQVPTEPNKGVSMVVMRGADGQVALPLFTNTEKYLKFSPNGMSCTIMTFGQFLQNFLRSKVPFLVVNPASEEALAIPQQQIREIVANANARRQQRPTK